MAIIRIPIGPFGLRLAVFKPLLVLRRVYIEFVYNEWNVKSASIAEHSTTHDFLDGNFEPPFLQADAMIGEGVDGDLHIMQTLRPP